MATMPMSGGGAMSMAWMRMPGQAWPGAAASFLGMWIAMTAAMMLPSLAPTLLRYRRAIRGAGETRRDSLTALVAAGYFFVWTAAGVAVFPLGAALAEIQMQQPALLRVVPVAVGVVIAIAGLLQRTAWKTRHLAFCRHAHVPCGPSPATAIAAWRHGLRLGVHCGYSCSGPMAIVLVTGVMDLRAMVVATIVVSAERLAPSGERLARVTGTVAVSTGALLIARAVALG